LPAPVALPATYPETYASFGPGGRALLCSFLRPAGGGADQLEAK